MIRSNAFAMAILLVGNLRQIFGLQGWTVLSRVKVASMVRARIRGSFHEIQGDTCANAKNSVRDRPPSCRWMASSNGVSSISEQASTAVRNDVLQTAWLVVGDGDLSYSAKLSSELSRRGGSDKADDPPEQLFATVLEDEETHNAVYKNSELHTETVRSHKNHKVLFGIDATRLESVFPLHSFDRIIFNFPHWPGKANTRYNRELLDQFLQSAAKVLKPGSSTQVRVALCHGQGGADATNLREWRLSWMAHEYAAEYGFLLKKLVPFGQQEESQRQYDLSSFRGSDRGFKVGQNPLIYIFGRPSTPVDEQEAMADSESIDPQLQMAVRHELRLVLDPEKLALSYFSESDLLTGDHVLELAREITPDGYVCEVPVRDVIVLAHTAPNPVRLLVFLIVYAGERRPLTRCSGDAIREELEVAAAQRFGLDVSKRDRMVSKPFPYPILPTLYEQPSQTIDDDERP